MIWSYPSSCRCQAAAVVPQVSYSVKLKVKTNGEMVNSQCECPAGAGPHSTCKHTAALAILLQRFVDTGTLGTQKSCTDVLQTFQKPKKNYQGSPMKVEVIPSKRKCHLEDVRPAKFRKMDGYNDYVRNLTVNYISKTGKDLAIRYIYKKANLQAAVADHAYLRLPFTEHWIDQALTVSPEQVCAIEKETREQSKSYNWYYHREWRLTASRFGDICHATERRDRKKLCQSILSSQPLTTPAVIHGKTYEIDAKQKCYNMHVSSSNAHFCFQTQNIEVMDAGLFVSQEHPFLAATPDGLVGDTHTVEIKCPFKGKDNTIQPGQKFPFLCFEGSELSLKKTSKYFDQVQGQMALTKRKSCYFIVYTLVDIKVINVQFDVEFWENSMLPKLQTFYKLFRSHVASSL